ncbi:hypothetical protein [Sorangium sp. So ce145]|uniref:hypothetical protein n=1 Tax=Sorangium sp. So ce145 TaxID=3133285 RepID=UPI003F62ED88
MQVAGRRAPGAARATGLTIAAEAGCPCTAQELARAYDEHVRAQPGASTCDIGYPVVDLSLRAPSDLSHAAVYLSLRASSSPGAQLSS